MGQEALPHLASPLRPSAPATLASLLSFRYVRHTPAPGPLHSLFLPQYLHDLFPYLLQVFAEMSPPLTLLFKVVASVLFLTHISCLLFLPCYPPWHLSPSDTPQFSFYHTFLLPKRAGISVCFVERTNEWMNKDRVC